MFSEGPTGFCVEFFKKIEVLRFVIYQDVQTTGERSPQEECVVKRIENCKYQVLWRRVRDSNPW